MSLPGPDRRPTMASVMTPFPFSVEADAPLKAAEQLMAEHTIHHIPVKEEGHLVGVVTARDLARFKSAQATGSQPKPASIRDVYVADPYIVDLHEPLDEVVRTMAEGHIDAALVVKHDQLVGIFTATDACRALAEFLESRYGGTDDDAA